jgi:hypothetical protein
MAHFIRRITRRRPARPNLNIISTAAGNFVDGINFATYHDAAAYAIMK